MRFAVVRQEWIKRIPLLMAVPAFVWQLLFLFVPLAVIVGLSFLKHWELFPLTTLTLEHYRALFTLTYYKIISRSLVLAVVTSTLCFSISYPIAYFLAFKVRRLQTVMLFFLVLPLWINFLVQIYAWFFMLEKQGLINRVLLAIGMITEPLPLFNSKFAVFLVLVYCYLPFMIMPLYTALEKIDKRLLEASYDLGAGAWETLSRVTLPLSVSGIRTGVLLVFVPVFGEFVIPALVGGDRSFFVGSLISYTFLTARDVSAGAAFTCLSLLVFACSALVIIGSIQHFVTKRR